MSLPKKVLFLTAFCFLSGHLHADFTEMQKATLVLVERAFLLLPEEFRDAQKLLYDPATTIDEILEAHFKFEVRVGRLIESDELPDFLAQSDYYQKHAMEATDVSKLNSYEKIFFNFYCHRLMPFLLKRHRPDTEETVNKGCDLTDDEPLARYIQRECLTDRPVKELHTLRLMTWFLSNETRGNLSLSTVTEKRRGEYTTFEATINSATALSKKLLYIERMLELHKKNPVTAKVSKDLINMYIHALKDLQFCLFNIITINSNNQTQKFSYTTKDDCAETHLENCLFMKITLLTKYFNIIKDRLIKKIKRSGLYFLELFDNNLFYAFCIRWYSSLTIDSVKRIAYAPHEVRSEFDLYDFRLSNTYLDFLNAVCCEDDKQRVDKENVEYNSSIEDLDYYKETYAMTRTKNFLITGEMKRKAIEMFILKDHQNAYEHMISAV